MMTESAKNVNNAKILIIRSFWRYLRFSRIYILCLARISHQSVSALVQHPGLLIAASASKL